MPSQEPPTDQQIQEVDPAPDDSDDNKGEGWGLGEGWVLCIYELMRCLCFGKDNVQFSLVWFGLVQPSIVQFGSVFFNLVAFGLVWFGLFLITLVWFYLVLVLVIFKKVDSFW